MDNKNNISKHTPGPWKVRFFKKEEPEAGFFIEAKNNNSPDLNYGIEIMGDDFGDHIGYPTNQRIADANLIASAPDLLETCKQTRVMLLDALGIFGGGQKVNQVYDMLNKAIDKAEGRNEL